MSLELLARRVYELHRAARGRRQAPMPPWDSLTETQRRQLTARYARIRASYDVGRTDPTESRL
jgi:hypothetical protein